MDLGTRIVLSIALLLALNNAIIRIPFLRDRILLFWAVQFCDIGVSVALLIWGIPGFEDMPAIAWMLSLLFLLHVAQNVRWLAARRRARGVDHEVEARRSAIRDALIDDEDEAESAQ